MRVACPTARGENFALAFDDEVGPVLEKRVVERANFVKEPVDDGGGIELSSKAHERGQMHRAKTGTVLWTRMAKNDRAVHREGVPFKMANSLRSDTVQVLETARACLANATCAS